MNCYNCGAEIDGKELICPYCGAENENVARAMQKDAINQYEELARKLEKEMPTRAVRRSSKVVLRVGLITFGIFVFGVIIAYIVAWNSEDNSLEEQKSQVDRLEAYYNAGHYEEMSVYLEDLSEKKNLGATYEKYQRVASFYDNMQWRIDSVKSESEFIAEIDLSVEDVALAMSYAFEEMVEIKALEEEGFLYGEEAGVRYVWDAYINAFKKYMLLTEEEIKQAVEKGRTAENGDITPYYDIAQLAIDRIKGE